MLTRVRQPTARRLPHLEGALPHPVMARVESLAPGSWTGLHQHPWVQLTYAMQGVLQVRTPEGLFMAPPQRAIWIPAHIPHEVLTSEAVEMRSLYIRTDAIPDVTLAAATQCCVVMVPALTRELILAFCDRHDSTQASSSPWPDNLHRLSQVLLDELCQAPVAHLDLPWPTDARLRRVCDGLLANPSDRKTLAQWGHEIGLTERSLVRLFHKQTGLSVGQWRRRLRLLNALDALQRGDKVAQVATACGYQSTSAFIHAFQHMFGHTPGHMFT